MTPNDPVIARMLDDLRGQRVFVAMRLPFFPAKFTIRGLLTLTSNSSIAGWKLRAQEPSDQIRLVTLDLHRFSVVDLVTHGEIGSILMFQNIASPELGIPASSLTIFEGDPVAYEDPL